MTEIRLATAQDVAYLPAIEQTAALRLRDVLPDLYALFSQHVMTVADFEGYLQAGLLWVAIEDQRPVGFIAASTIDGHGHIDEVDVLPAYGRRGIGRALIETVCDWAKDRGLTSVTLSTQENVPWNAPFYARLGFRVLAEAEWSDAYHALRQQEAELGVPMTERVLMIRDC